MWTSDINWKMKFKYCWHVTHHSPWLCHKWERNPGIAYSMMLIFLWIWSFSQDFLFVGAGPIPDENLLYSLSGTEVPGALVGESSMMWMRFFSDDSMQYSGFKLTYTSLESKLNWAYCERGIIQGVNDRWGTQSWVRVERNKVWSNKIPFCW